MRCASVTRMRIGVAALLLVGALMVGGCQAASGEAFQHSFNQPIMLGDKPVGQTFRPATSHVAGVDVLVATFDETVDPAGRLRAVLRDGAGGPVLARTSVDGADIGNNEWAPVRFSPPPPAPAVAAVELTWDGASPLAVWANTPLDDGGGLRNDPYPGGELVRGGEPAVGDLAFRVVGTGSPADAARNLLRIARDGASRLAGDPLFAALWLVLVGGAVWLGVGNLRRPPGELGERRRGEQPREHEEARP